MHSIMDLCPLGAKVQREPQTGLRVEKLQKCLLFL